MQDDEKFVHNRETSLIFHDQKASWHFKNHINFQAPREVVEQFSVLFLAHGS